MDYYYLHEIDEGENVSFNKKSHFSLNPRLGKPLDFNPDEAVYFTLMAGEDYGYDQFDPDFDGDVQDLTLNQRLKDYYDHDALFSEGIITVLREEAEACIQLIPINITNEFNDEPIAKDFKMLNIVHSFLFDDIKQSNGTICAADFHELSIQPDDVLYTPIFRLLPIGAIIVNDRIASRINKGGFKGIKAYLLGSE